MDEQASAKLIQAMEGISNVMSRVNTGVSQDHDLLIALNTKFDTLISHTLRDIENTLGELQIEMKDRAKAAELHSLEARFEKIETHVTNLQNRRAGITDFLGMTWKAWVGLSGIILFIIAVLSAIN